MLFFVNNLVIALQNTETKDSIANIQATLAIPTFLHSKLSTISEVFQALEEELYEPGEELMLASFSGDEAQLVETFKSSASYLEAAGGFCFSESSLLLIHRRGHWDLPKGKVDAGEHTKEAALREVREETGVSATMIDYLDSSYHFYLQGKELYLKKTYWYLMKAQNTSLVPQADEDITEASWKSLEETKALLADSYPSLRYLFLSNFMSLEAFSKS